MRQQTKLVEFQCETCGATSPIQEVVFNAPSPTEPVIGTWHTLKVHKNPSQWQHYCDECWHFYEPDKVRFIRDWNDAVARGIFLSEELCQGWYDFAGGWYVAQLMGIRMTEPFTGGLFYSPGNYNCRVEKALARQWEMGEELTQVHGMIDSGQMQNLPRTQHPHAPGYVETAHFDAQLPGDSIPNSEKVTQYHWGIDPYRGTRYSMQQLQDEMIQEAILTSPEFQQVVRFSQLMEQMKDLILNGKESDVEVKLFVCDPADGDCVKVERKLILHGDTIEVDRPDELVTAIQEAQDKLEDAR